MISNFIKSAVESNDVIKVRAIILKKFNLDRKREEFEAEVTFNYAEEVLKKKNFSILEIDDGESSFSEDKDKWNREFL